MLCRKRMTGRTWISLPLSVALCSTAAAANWEVEPRVQAGYRYSDNFRLYPKGQEVDVSGGEADVGVTFRTVDPRTNFEITPRLVSTYFPNERSEDANNYYLTGGWSDVTPRRRFNLPFLYSEEDVVRSELPDAGEGGDLGQPTEGDSGRFLQRNRRNFFRIAPEFEYDISQRYRMELNAHYLDATFDRQLSGFQQDFSEVGAGAGLGVLTSQRSALSFRAVAFQYETTTTTDAYGGELEWNTQYSPNSRAYVRVGAQQTKPERGSSDTNITAGAGGQWSSARNTLFIDLTRSVGPVSAGTVVERHQLRVRIDHDVSQRFALRAGARLSRDEQVEDGTYPTREYATGELGFEWRWLRQWSLVGTYNYRWQEYEDEPLERDANSFLLGIVYEPKRRD
ncbi:hypothetical protein JM946_24945 [Steroidobacter sp. S1-65]|uniref:Outer membrane beta-barrel protein n=1 Tax=Steroidobacter gossypii TaxID=2805490 RepID=A0ABS1X440_9GAMM|nr:hypothetical protein [Steroidobacter gossypii]MBM0107991.1 hypothetical protein [Steroidobacter gossypii]